MRLLIPEQARVRIPEDFVQLCVMHAYLGQIDVRPALNPSGGSTGVNDYEFWAERINDAKLPALTRVEGISEVSSKLSHRNDGASYYHEIKLRWEGFIEMDGNQMSLLLLYARGTEILKWRSEAIRVAPQNENLVASLPAGRPIDQKCEVRYGIIGEPISAHKANALFIGGGHRH